MIDIKPKSSPLFGLKTRSVFLKINVIGTSGSGKTTFGRVLAQNLEIPFIEMDALFWEPDWGSPIDEEFFPRLTNALKGESWVLDGNYSRTLAIKWNEVDIVIWLDYSFIRTVFQAIQRAISRIISQEELWPGTGNWETFRKLFSKDSIVLWTISTYARKRKRISEYMKFDEYSDIKFIQLKSPSESDHFLNRIETNPELI